MKKPWRDRTKHLEKSLLEFMQLPIERPVCGDQIHWLYVSSGPDAEGHERLLNGVELNNQKAAVRVLLVSAHH